MQLKIKLPRGEAIADFPSGFNQRGKKKSTDAFLNSVVSGVLNTIASLKPGFADLILGTEFRDIKFREIEFREIEDLKLNADLDFNRNPTRRRRR